MLLEERDEMELLVKNQGTAYSIVIEGDFQGLEERLRDIQVEGRKICIVTDTNVSPLYLCEVKQRVEKVAKQVIAVTIPAGEEHKTLDTVREIYKELIEHKFDRKDLLLALGGGVVGDICGFAAATYLRGVRFIQMPTTLLSQVDSSIGGKTGVDFDAYKNMVGAFHMPALVYINVATLKSLPKKELASGMGEVLKHGLIRNRKYYDWLIENAKAIEDVDVDVCSQVVLESDKIKRAVVEEDPTEQGVRGHLNYGHTLGHAIEKQMNFSLSHGACVALGMLAAMQIQVARGTLDQREYDKLKSALKKFSLPTHLGKIDIQAILENTKNDKKREAGQVKFILLEEIGKAVIDRTVSLDEMEAALKKIQHEE